MRYRVTGSENLVTACALRLLGTAVTPDGRIRRSSDSGWKNKEKRRRSLLPSSSALWR